MCAVMSHTVELPACICVQDTLDERQWCHAGQEIEGV